MGLLVPEYFFACITRITPEFLREQGVKYLALDVDNTLTGHGSQQLEPEVAAWLEKMRGEGFGMMVASNNTKKRVQPFAARIGLPYISFCCKPGPLWLCRAKRMFGAKKAEIALVGDQIFTDLLGGQLYGAKVFLLKPMYKDIKPTIRLKRRLEKPLLARYFKQGKTLL